MVVILLLFFGAGRLPDIARSLGEPARKFRLLGDPARAASPARSFPGVRVEVVHWSTSNKQTSSTRW